MNQLTGKGRHCLINPNKTRFYQVPPQAHFLPTIFQFPSCHFPVPFLHLVLYCSCLLGVNTIIVVILSLMQMLARESSDELEQIN